ncbi:MAG: type II toxin-antitoxin system RelB/DinJ family antitoxin [Clostridia bacterium]|nr:type II toxin-antitoxin system RelB/DinJ family antitoxin [Clostridia bacterium]
MPILTVKVDETLKNDAGAVLDELGLERPTAVRMYLKAVVRENGLPICTSLNGPTAPCACRTEAETPCCCACEEPAVPAEPEKEPAPAAEKPAAPTDKNALVSDFVSLICSVPAGSLTRWTDMEACLTERAGTEVVRPVRVNWPEANAAGEPVPYWRVVTERGAVRGDAFITKEAQEEKLKKEGHAFIPAGHGIFSGIKVEGYRKKLVKF